MKKKIGAITMKKYRQENLEKIMNKIDKRINNFTKF